MNSIRAKNSAFIEMFGEYPLIKVLDFFLTYPSFDYSKTQVANEIGISRITIEKIWKELIEKGIILKTRDMGNAELYKLNTENPRVRVLMKIDFELASAYFGRETESVRMPVKVSRHG